MMPKRGLGDLGDGWGQRFGVLAARDNRAMSGFDPFAGKAPRWFTIAPERPFIDDLAFGLLQWMDKTRPEALTELVVLVPNRRTARELGQALARQSGERPVLLPQVRPLGDLDDDAPPFTPGSLGLDLDPAIDPLARRFELADLVSRLHPEPLGFAHALELAQSLGQFLDSLYLEEVESVEALAGLVHGDMARHWQQSADLLTAVAQQWPERLRALGLVDPAWRRTRLLRLLAEQWIDNPPSGPVLVAGSVGPSPAARAVLHAIAAAPRGAVVLPGLDQDLDQTAWAAIDDSHPQAALKRLLASHGRDKPSVDRHTDVRPWPVPSDPAEIEPTEATAANARGRARARLLNEALRPAEATDDWRGAVERLNAEFPAQPVMDLALEGLSILAVRAEEEAASTLALLMREVLETPGKTCALVTPDLALARRVEARLLRWGIIPDTSGGAPLSRTPLGHLLLAAAKVLDTPHDPVALLALFKHPAVQQVVTRVGGRQHLVPEAIETLERYGLRGPKPRDSSDLQRRLRQAAARRPQEDAAAHEARSARIDRALEALAAIEALMVEFEAGQLEARPISEATRRWVGLIEAVAGQAVWAERDGEAAAELLARLIRVGDQVRPAQPSEFAELVRRLLDEQVVRHGNATHPRLMVLGTVEARLIRADRMIVAGLEEGVWPAGPPIDPFLSRPMRRSLGLPSPEQRLGEVAQDFIHAACAPEVILVHSERRGGQPAVRSRWLWRLDMLRKAAPDASAYGTSTPARQDPGAVPALDWARRLDSPPPGPAAYASRPAPTPPVALRPRSLAVTGVERWIRDPYAIYAERILGLKSMDRPDASAEALARGTALHAAMQAVAETWPGALPDMPDTDIADQIAAWFRTSLTQEGFDEVDMARETPLADNLAEWIVAFEHSRRRPGLSLHAERRGETQISVPYAPFDLSARADRIEVSPDGTAILDFKTGTVPGKAEVAVGLAPQLTLTAAILARGGFPGLGTIDADELAYVRLTGRQEPGKVTVVAKPDKTDPQLARTLATQALEGLIRRIERFDDPQTPYRSWEFPKYRGNFGGNYDHLARVWEWHVAGAGDDAGDSDGGDA